MAVQILNSKQKNIQYDLSIKKHQTLIKSYTTRNINNQNTSRLKALKEELEKSPNNKFAIAKDLIKKIATALNDIDELPEIIITTTKGKYDINQPKRYNCLIARIKAYSHATKSTELKKLLAQVNSALVQYPDNTNLKTLQVKLSEIIKNIEAKDNYVPYTELLKKEFSVEKSTRKSHKSITAYLNQSVTKKKAVGQDSIDKLSACFWLDFFKNIDFFDGDTDREKVIFFLVLLKQFYSHNASYYPANGFGKSGEAECEKALFYLRSQTKHHETAYCLKFENSTYGKQNAAYLAMVKESKMISREYRELTNRIKANGTLTKKIKNERLGETLAHAGSRVNNVTQTAELLANAYDKSLDDKFSELKKHISQKNVKKTFNKKIYSKKIQATRSSFRGLKVKNYLHKNIMTDIMNIRNKVANNIQSQCDKLDLAYISIEVPKYSSFLYISFYPDINNLKLKESSNIREGLTNTLIGFFGGLVNYYAKQDGLHYVLTRRQSFGFLRPTVTDIGSLRMRISLGVDSEKIEKIYIKSIKKFNKLLKSFNFISPTEQEKNSTEQQLVKKCLSVCEDSVGKKVTSNTGNHLRAAMRCEDDQWIALLVAEKFLNEDQGDISAAFKNYLEKFIYQRARHKKISEGEHKKIPRSGYSFINNSQVKINNPNRKKLSELLEQNPLLKLLHNFVETTVSYVNSLPTLHASASTDYVLHKLLRNCQKGLAILNNAHKYEISHILAKANCVIENIQEFLTILRVLAKDIDSSITELKTIEKARFSNTLNIHSERCHIFYNDGGLQAINTGIMAMGFEGMHSVYLCNDCYYEIEKFCTDSGIKTSKKADKADIWLCDITKLDVLKEQIATCSKINKAPRAIIIDITNNSTAPALEDLQTILDFAKTHNMWAILSCSTLKHGQFGNDKYQSGRNVFIAPSEQKALTKRTTLKHLEAISDTSMSSLFASYRQIVETVSNREKCGELLKKFGLFNTETPKDKKIITKIETPNSEETESKSFTC